MLFDEQDGGGGGGSFSGAGGIQAMGILNALKTGDMFLDMIIAMLIPVVIRMGLKFLSKFDGISTETIQRWWRKRQSQHERIIQHKMQRNSWGDTMNMDEDTQNTVLLKAIQLYLHQYGKLKLQVADLDLTSMQDSYCSIYCDGGYDSDDEESKTLAGTLSQYKIIKKPPTNRWHDLGTYDNAIVRLRIEENVEEEQGEDKKTNRFQTTTFRFTSPGPTSIDAFIDKAYNWYISELRRLEDKDTRHYYELKSLGGAEGDSSSIVYNRYKLSDEKTFQSLFFQQKDTLLNLIAHFQAKTGKYGISGYPHKLGLLLHGPPGTGKTSMIKALAQHTGRSIVTIPLARISTNSELMDMFFEKKRQVNGEYVPVKLDFKDVIFVMEDVDAASKVVRRRDGLIPGDDMGMPSIDDESIDLPPPKSTWRLLLESNDETCQEVVKLLIEKSSRLEEEATDPAFLKSIAARANSIPGLGLVGEGYGDEIVSQLGNDAIEAASKAVEALEGIDRYLAVHAKNLKSALEAGAKVDDAFVEELFGLTPATEEGAIPNFRSMQAPSPARRNISYSKYDDKAEEALFGEQQNEMMMAAAMSMRDNAATTAKAGSSASGDAAIGPSLWSKPRKDQLNLTGLLNVLDGVVDTPGRILIMTTNHPEMLDPALVRPGRIDKKIMLGYMRAVDVIHMIEHYFQQTLDDLQRSQIEEVSMHLNLTPAQVEQMTAESEEVDEMISVLQQRAGVPMTTTPTEATSPASTVFDEAS